MGAGGGDRGGYRDRTSAGADRPGGGDRGGFQDRAAGGAGGGRPCRWWRSGPFPGAGQRRRERGGFRDRPSAGGDRPGAGIGAVSGTVLSAAQTEAVFAMVPARPPAVSAIAIRSSPDRSDRSSHDRPAHDRPVREQPMRERPDVRYPSRQPQAADGPVLPADLDAGRLDREVRDQLRCTCPWGG